MPKVIDNYVLQEKIGSGQFGDVFIGFNQQTHMQVAIKTIKRQTIKGKFYQLLQNQIKVLKTCNNPHIMQLYALKRTANHYYLILQYCNNGDMLQQLKKQKRIQQSKVIKYFCQILTGFQTLVKHKIMHRDFKLANILLHDDNIKIADFGFSKLLNQDDYTSTMLGSPLNMAPEVLGGNKYNNKADIWSIGACIYEMLVGKPPYMANNMVDLLKVINTKPLTFPPDLKIHPILMDCLRKMLIPDVKKRISWNDLFSHPINRHLDNQLRKQIDLQLIDDQSLMLNTSKFYLKNNLVVGNVQDIQNKQKINNSLIGIINKREKSGMIQQEDQIEDKNNQSNINKSKKKEKEEKMQKINQSEIQSQQQQTPIIQKKWKKHEKTQPQLNLSYLYRKNSKLLLHFRNIYAFLATIVDQVTTLHLIQPQCQLVSLIIIKKILITIKFILSILHSQSLPSVPSPYPSILSHLSHWPTYKTHHQYHQVRQYIQKQYNVFLIYNQSLQSNIKQKIINGLIQGENKQIGMKLLLLKQEEKGNYQQIDNNMINKLFQQNVYKYLQKVIKFTVIQTLNVKDYKLYEKCWKHIEKVLVCYNYQHEFKLCHENQYKHQNQNQHQNKNKNDKNKLIHDVLFDFNKFYEEKEKMTPQEILINVESKLIKIKNKII